jgi:choline kinase
MRAVLLAAGRGRRLGSAEPKCLISIDGRTLLDRHLANMSEAGVTALTIVVGFEKERILAMLAELRPALPVEIVENPRFVHGSIVSLQVAAERLLDGAVWMDADVLYPAALLGRLLASPHESCMLLDGRSEESGEEMMVAIRGGRAVKIARRVGAGPEGSGPQAPRWDFAGESVGFAKVGPAGGRVMKRILDEEVAAGRLDQEYEAAMERAFAEVPFGHERVDDFAWTEIDFEEDVVKARKLAREL